MKGFSSAVGPYTDGTGRFEQSQVDEQLTAVVIPVVQHDRANEGDFAASP